MKTLKHISTLGLAAALSISTNGCGRASIQKVLTDLGAQQEGVARNPDGSFTAVACHKSLIQANARDLARSNAEEIIANEACGLETTVSHKDHETTTYSSSRARITGLMETGASDDEDGDSFIHCVRLKANVDCE